MNKKICKICLMLFVSTTSLVSAHWNSSVKFRGGAYFPTEHRFKRIYGKALPVYEVETTIALKKRFQGWINVNWLNKHGSSDRLHYSTTIRMASLSTGGSFLLKIAQGTMVYAGLGYSLSNIDLKNHCTALCRRKNKYISGLALKSGILLDVNCRLFTDFFVDYVFLDKQFRTRVLLGGFKIGAGVGYKF